MMGKARKRGRRQTRWLTLAEELYQRCAFGGLEDCCGSHLRVRGVGAVEEVREEKGAEGLAFSRRARGGAARQDGS